VTREFDTYGPFGLPPTDHFSTDYLGSDFQMADNPKQLYPDETPTALVERWKAGAGQGRIDP